MVKTSAEKQCPECRTLAGTSKALTVGITTRNRADDLIRTVLSLTYLRDLVVEVLVMDNGSEPPIEPALQAALPADFPLPVQVIRFDADPGYIKARNRIVECASTDYVLNLDDDIQIISAEAIQAGLRVIRADPLVGAVAFAQACPDGTPWGPRAQPSPAQTPTEVPSFIGFAHLLRRTLFLRLGGYRGFFVYMAEEKEFCLRLMNAGYKVVYLPSALIVHFTSPVGRDSRRWLRMNTRNQLLSDIMNLPLPIAVGHLGWHTAQYFWHRRAFRVSDPWGFWWVLRQTVMLLPEAMRNRKPVHYKTYRFWRRLRKAPVPYSIPGSSHSRSPPP